MDLGAFYGQDNSINLSVTILIFDLGLLDLSKRSHASQQAFVLRLKV